MAALVIGTHRKAPFLQFCNHVRVAASMFTQAMDQHDHAAQASQIGPVAFVFSVPAIKRQVFTVARGEGFENGGMHAWARFSRGRARSHAPPLP